MPDFAGTHLLCEHEKSEIRSKLLAARREIFSSVAQVALSNALNSLVESLVAEHPSSPHRPLIACYVPMVGEPGWPDLPRALAARIRSGRLLLPVLRKDLDLDWAEYTGDQDLRSTRCGPREPTGPRLGRSAITDVDLIVTPAVAVDESGVRLGRGGGSYDRALARVPDGVPIVVPLYSGEYVRRLPREPHDRPVTTVLLLEGETVRTIGTGRGRGA